MHCHPFLIAVAAMAACGGAAADTPSTIASAYADAAHRETTAFAGFSAERGARFFQSTHGNDWSCASCHTANPAAAGKHAKTGKAIAPLAPAANPERFSDADVAEKWFKRNCNDVLGRACTAQEKGDVLAYLVAQKP
jgi:hypothetical protein